MIIGYGKNGIPINICLIVYVGCFWFFSLITRSSTRFAKCFQVII